MVLGQQVPIDTRLVVEALEIRLRNEHHEIAVSRLVHCEQEQMIRELLEGPFKRRKGMESR